MALETTTAPGLISLLRKRRPAFHNVIFIKIVLYEVSQVYGDIEAELSTTFDVLSIKLHMIVILEADFGEVGLW